MKRAKYAISDLLLRQLLHPKIFFYPCWPYPNERVDLLAIDRAGFGDIHVMQIQNGLEGVEDAIRFLKEVPAHYRWLGIALEWSERHLHVPPELLESAGSSGRIGVIRVKHKPEDRLSSAIDVQAIRSAGDYRDKAERFIKRFKPDYQVRPPRFVPRREVYDKFRP